MSQSCARLWLLALCCAVGCAAPRVDPESHGVSVEPGPCGRGLVVVQSDYQSSNVSLLDFEGHVLSASLVSSSTESSGFGVSLGADAVPPSSAQPGSRLVLIDRYPAGVLRFVDLGTGQIAAELSVSTGFRSNPQDYLAVGPDKAYVARYETNPNPGRQLWDAGGDLLLVDPSAPAIIGRVDLAPAMLGEAANFSAHPARLVQVAGRVFALLASYANDYTEGGTTSRLVELDPRTDALLSTLLLDGLRGCAGLALSPNQTELAVACTGDDLASIPPQLGSSGLAVIDISGVPRLTQRLLAAEFGRDAVGFGLDYAAPGVLVFSTLGYFRESGAVGALDTLLRLDTASGRVEEILRSEAAPFTLGAVHCVPGCEACFAADAQRLGGSVLRFPLDPAGELGPPRALRVETRIGLPPRYLGEF